jgi:phosphosulfolactate synthase
MARVGTEPEGLTMVIDSGLPTGAFGDVIASYGSYIDFVKFGWGTAVVTPDLPVKLETLRQAGIGFFFGGTLFERFCYTGRLPEYVSLLRDLGVSHVEVSNGTIPLDQRAKSGHVRDLAEEFVVLAEVGFKDCCRSAEMSPREWVEAVRDDLVAGAAYVITETRESGRSGIARPDGTLRDDVLQALLDEVPADRLLFEAPTKELQVELIRCLGPNVNLGNVAPSDVLSLETLRRGLRADTLLELTPLLSGSAPGLHSAA